jgi:quercetin dioxygenase-like cupin family protein
MAYRVLSSRDAFWRPSNQMRVENTDLAKQLEAETLGARLWRLHSGQASTKHRHFEMHELYVLIGGPGRMRVDDEVLTLEPLSAVLVEPEHMRQVFNDTDGDALWLIVGAPREGVTSTLDMSEEQLAFMYPEGPRALPPELGGGEFTNQSDRQSS